MKAFVYRYVWYTDGNALSSGKPQNEVLVVLAEQRADADQNVLKMFQNRREHWLKAGGADKLWSMSHTIVRILQLEPQKKDPWGRGELEKKRLTVEEYPAEPGLVVYVDHSTIQAADRA